jgi:hypothetical protein
MSVASAQPLLRTRSFRADVLIVGVATTYVTVSTADLKLGGAPLKLFAVLVALVTWLLCARPWERMRAFRFGVPVLITGVIVPVVWFAIAAILAHTHDPAQRDGLSNAVQEASRFVYLLLYFPLADRKWLGDGWERLWVWPALLLCAITVALFAGHLLGADYGTSGTVGPFQGTIGTDGGGTFRAFLINDIALLPLFAILIARASRGGTSRTLLAGAVLVLAAAYLAHARGLWLGMGATVVVMALAAMPRGWPSRVRRAAWSVAVLAGLGGLIALTDPNLVRGFVRALTARNELSTAARLDQAPQLLSGFRRDVFAGSGLGATLPSGFVRDPSTPWTFELTYLQLLFEVGAIGLAAVLAPALSCLWRSGRSLRGAVLAERPFGFAVLGGLAGFVLAAAGNPYLLTSVGMYVLAVFVAAAERESATPPSARGSSRGGAAVVAVAAIGVLALTALEFRAPRAIANETVRDAPAVKLAVPHSAARLLREPLAADPAGRQLWSFMDRRGSIVATPLSLVGHRLVIGALRDLGAALPLARYQVADWNGTPAAFELIPRRASLAVRVVSLSGPLRVLARTGGSLPPLTAGWSRDLAVATAASGAAEAVSVDRSTASGRFRISWFALSRSGQPRTLEETAALGPFAPRRWSVQVGSVSTPGPDIGLIGTPPGSVLQIHVLTAASNYAAFGEQRPIGVPGVRGRSLKFLVGQRDGRPVLFVIDPARGAIDEVQL